MKSEVLYEFNRMRNFVACEIGVAMFEAILAPWLCPRFEHHEPALPTSPHLHRHARSPRNVHRRCFTKCFRSRPGKRSRRGEEHVFFAIHYKKIHSSSYFARSPVWNQPSASIASLLAAGLLKSRTNRIALSTSRQFGSDRAAVVVSTMRASQKVRAANRPSFANGIFRARRRNPRTEFGHAETLLEANVFFFRDFSRRTGNGAPPLVEKPQRR